MTSRRIAKVAQAMRETISSCILRGLKDPRVRDVTVLNVDVSDDTRTAKVYVSVMGDERVQALCLHGLNSARGYLQRKVADRVQTRYTPVLTFVLDSSVKRSVATSRILREIAAENALHAGSDSADPPGPPDDGEAGPEKAVAEGHSTAADDATDPLAAGSLDSSRDNSAESGFGPESCSVADRRQSGSHTSGSQTDPAEMDATPEDSS